MSSRLTPEVSRMEPSQSILAGRLTCWIFRVTCSRMRATTASGTQTKNVQRQPERAVDDEAAEQRAAGGAHGHDAAHVAGVLAAVARRDHGADDGLGQGGEAAHGRCPG